MVKGGCDREGADCEDELPGLTTRAWMRQRRDDGADCRRARMLRGARLAWLAAQCAPSGKNCSTASYTYATEITRPKTSPEKDVTCSVDDVGGWVRAKPPGRCSMCTRDEIVLLRGGCTCLTNSTAPAHARQMCIRPLHTHIQPIHGTNGAPTRSERP